MVKCLSSVKHLVKVRVHLAAVEQVVASPAVCMLLYLLAVMVEALSSVCAVAVVSCMELLKYTMFAMLQSCLTPALM